MSEDTNSIEAIFEELFSRYRDVELRGTEQEILAMKAVARMWFSEGVRKASEYIFPDLMRSISKLRADVDTEWGFVNNIR